MTLPADVARLDPWARARFRWLAESKFHPSDPRPEQVIEADEAARIVLFLAGRGWGKTRVGAEDVSEYCRTHPGERYAGVFETFGDGRDVGVEGESGILACVPPECVADWNRSLGELVFTNGSRFDIYSAEKPDSLRGPQHHRAWVDEPAKMKHLGDTWDNLMFGLRLGTDPKCVVTGTPKPIPLIKDLIARSTTRVVRGSTFDNARNLSESALDELRLRYEGTRLGRQELHGEILDDYEGALWNREDLEADRIYPGEVPDLWRTCVGIDPSTWGPELGQAHESVGQGLETGVVAAGVADRGSERHVYVLADASGRRSPTDWARDACGLYGRLKANALVPEKNNAGWVGSVLRGVDPDVHIDGVHARKGKRIRAEPVAALSEQHRLHMVGSFPELEDQLCFPAGTLVETIRGPVPIEVVSTSDLAWTRRGWRPVTWSGPTGRQSLVSVSHALGRFLCTPGHPIWTETRGYVPAASVRRSDRLAVAPHAVSTATRSRGAAAGGTGWKAATTGTPDRTVPGSGTFSSTVPYGRLIEGRSLLVSTSTIATRIPETTGPATWSSSHPPSTSRPTSLAASAPGTSTGAPSRLDALGPNGNPENGPAPTAGPCSPRRASALVSVAVLAVEPLAGMVDVYDLTVADAHEFLADGVLVHNCGWDPSESWSPDRLDAMVHAVTWLKPWGSRGGLAVSAADRSL